MYHIGSGEIHSESEKLGILSWEPKLGSQFSCGIHFRTNYYPIRHLLPNQMITDWLIFGSEMESISELTFI